MERGKVKVKRIENHVRRQVKFCKRKRGLFKKAAELSLLCDAQIALIIFSPSGKLYEFGSPNVSRNLTRHQKYFASKRLITQESQDVEELLLEAENLANVITSLEKTKRHMIGEDFNDLSFKELQSLERQVEVGVKKIRLRKETLLIEHIRSLSNEGRSLQPRDDRCKGKMLIFANRIKSQVRDSPQVRRMLLKVRLQ